MTQLSPTVMESKRRGMLARMMPEAIIAAKKAAMLRDEVLIDYLTRIVLDAANRDLDEWQKKRSKEKK